MSDSLQHTLDRVRRPRVQVTYDVDTGDALEKKELPLVVGVMADLSGKPSTPNAPLKERSFVPIDRDNFDDVLAKSNARVATRVDNKLTDDDTQLNVELNLRSMEDFEPEQVLVKSPHSENCWTCGLNSPTCSESWKAMTNLKNFSPKCFRTAKRHKAWQAISRPTKQLSKSVPKTYHRTY